MATTGILTLTASVASVRGVREYCRMMARELGTTWDSQPHSGAVWPRDTGDMPSPGTWHLPEHQERSGWGWAEGPSAGTDSLGGLTRVLCHGRGSVLKELGKDRGACGALSSDKSTAKLCYHT